MTKAQELKNLLEGSKIILKVAVRKKINKELTELVSPKNQTRYFKAIPLQDIENILSKYGSVILQEDNTLWSGFFTGADGRATIAMAPEATKFKQNGLGMYTSYDNAELQLQWHKMPSGNYEINVYVS